MKTTLAILPTRVLAGLHRMTASDDVRYYLNGVYYEPDTGIFVATDGHALIAHKAPSAIAHTDVAPFIIPGDILKQASKAKTASVALSIDREASKSKGTVILEPGCLANDDTFASAGTSHTAAEIDGRFPEWRRVVPTTISGKASQFDPELYARAAKAFADISGSKRAIPAIAHNGPENAAIVTCGDVSTFVVLMPFRNAVGDMTPTLEHFGLVKEAAIAAAA